MAKPPPKNFNVNSKTIAVPVAAFTMACLLFVYARASIPAAKRNAQRHREADGGQISWRNESLRRHGALEKPQSEDPLRSWATGAREKVEKVAGKGTSEQEDILRSRKARRG
ncbi:hypothetical protein MMC09_005388 [Bachmanniomyces sp. S44760]|nr:hypothetical protein [Bachmanniomyces sp. S44760]